MKERSQLLIGGRGKVQTICSPLQENPWECDIQDIGHFESMYGESLWKKKVPVSEHLLRNKRELRAFLRQEEDATYITLLARKDHAGIRGDVPVQLRNKCFKIRKGTTVGKLR